MGRPLSEHSDAELTEALRTHSEHVVVSYNDVANEIERRSQRLYRRLAIATSVTSVLVATAALIVSTIALVHTQ